MAYLLKFAALVLAYFLSGKAGLKLEPEAGFATLVWPPTGISLAALVLWGRNLWPAVAVGAFAVNFSGWSDLPLVLGIAVGNTLEAYVGYWLLTHGAGRFHPSLDRPKDAVRLVFPSAALSTVLSATLGVTSLLWSGRIASDAYVRTWSAWWVGDFIGDLLIAPLLLVWASGVPREIYRGRQAQAVLSGTLLVMATLAVFHTPPDSLVPYSEPFLIFPFLLWAAMRFRLHGATAATLIVAAIAIAATVNGFGPFVKPTLTESLLHLQTFVAAAALTSLLLGAATAQDLRACEELARANASLAEAVQTREDFLSIASHELKTPVTAIKLQLQLALRAGPAPSNKAVETALRQLGRLTRLIEDLLDLARIKSGKLRYEFAPADLSALAAEVAARLAEELKIAGCRLETDISPGISGMWDRARLEQVFTNLLSNAARHAPGSAVSLRVWREGRIARIRLRDTGPGIPEPERERLFEAFGRSVSSQRVGGLGLGLYIVNQIVREHGGHIRLEDTGGKGASFLVELPIAGPLQSDKLTG